MFMYSNFFITFEIHVHAVGEVSQNFKMVLQVGEQAAASEELGRKNRK
jgi:hypothetical protein